MNKNLQRFINYVKIDTQSDDSSLTSPSTSKQFDLAKVLLAELENLGVVDLELNEFGIIYGRIKGNRVGPTIGFNAHIDTAMDCSGKNVTPQVIYGYQGQDITLPKGGVISTKDYPILKEKIGHTLVTASGDTLLGADDKAGVALIVALAEHLHQHPEILHGDILISFTPDEEIGRGTENFDIKKFQADFAYTMDGSHPNIVEYENFNAASADVLIHGISIHPGTAKDKMVNASEVAMEFHSLLPAKAKPQFTEGYQGFNHLTNISGGCDECRMHYIIRNHDDAILELQKADFLDIKNQLNEKYGYNVVDVTLTDGYKNMKICFEGKMTSVDLAYAALKKNGFMPMSSPIRGGTDGASITYQGVPCPNLGTGGYNFHGRHEFLDFSEFEKMLEVLIDLVQMA